MFGTNCKHTQAHLVAYVHNELPPHVRRRIALHLNRCEHCYAAYLTQRTLANELASTVRFVGQPGAPQLNRVWNAIQADMNRPQPVIHRYGGRFSVAMLILLLALLLPWSLDKQQIALAVPSQPAPGSIAQTEAAATAEARFVVLASATDTAIPPAETPGAP